PVTLVQGGVDQREAAATVDESEDIGPRARWVGWLRLDAEVEARGHPKGQWYVLPEDPLPRNMVRVPAFERGRDIQRDLEVECIDGNAVRPCLGRCVPQHEAQCQWNEEARGEPAHELE